MRVTSALNAGIPEVMTRADVPPSSLRHLLRERTREAHAALDALVGGIADEAAYRRYLRGLYAFRAPAEAAVGRAGPPGFADWPPARLAPRIAADLDDLAEPRPAPEPWATPDPSAAAGMLYVLEGAAIGANILRGRAARLGFDADHGARHLARPAEPGRWAAFVLRLDGGEIDRAAAVEGARAAFAGAARAFAAASLAMAEMR